ncbi:translation initiation factor eIF-2A [Gloeophyllum trabeum ATCC 11539]|uniref:Eukaryotic translation initiation factor 2A n=1 Tax=Gloeophyllum trabeum (strain ATCC 11539 / FP-39264 / Madison 617) TaxID=670483 RepID=S7PRY0_GLOTA|nr:translation initiation factor eIF-2A [Gloeophyllum trabeum ATCC 11539]EPQ50143.1 translation initiation factor eIF-2A [Gloeophyllum trabeum ATCC 11539]
MSSQITQQYAFRAQKSIGLVHGSPSYEPVQGFEAPEGTARVYQYSPDGRLWALAVPSGVRIYRAEGAQLLQELPVPNVVELNFSPRGTYLSTWERPVKLEDGSQHKNLRVFSVSTGEELVAFSQKGQEGWDLQYTISESHAIRLVGQEIQVYRPSEWSKGIVDKLKVEDATSVSLSPGLNPSLAVFVGEKKGAPASVKIYNLLTLASPPTCQKNFYKADRAQIKWNMLGTQVLVLTHTDVDKTNKSYYGETGLYLLSAAGNFDCRVTLDKEGPIHDFAWSPNSKEFGVVYGYMPAKAMLFDQRVRMLHDFGSGPHNFISFNPQGRLILLAGFGNLAGKMSVIDRKILSQVASIEAPNTSWCEWSPDGRFILTATLSPRLRVDNGIKIWHCSGPLMHVQAIDELYQTSWRPTPVDSVPAFPQVVPPAPPPGASVASQATVAKPTPTKPAGAYRPPGARGLATPAIFKREDEGGLPSSGQSTPSRGYSRSPAPPGANGDYHRRDGRRHVPGAPQSPSPGPDGDRKGNNRKRKGPKAGKKEDGTATPPTNGVEKPSIDLKVNGVPVAEEVSVPPTPGGDGSLDPVAKKVRNLNKKLKAIEELKEKQSRGERLEATQLKKIESEAEIRKELGTLSVGGS